MLLDIDPTDLDPHAYEHLGLAFLHNLGFYCLMGMFIAAPFMFLCLIIGVNKYPKLMVFEGLVAAFGCISFVGAALLGEMSSINVKRDNIYAFKEGYIEEYKLTCNEAIYPTSEYVYKVYTYNKENVVSHGKFQYKYVSQTKQIPHANAVK